MSEAMSETLPPPPPAYVVAGPKLGAGAPAAGDFVFTAGAGAAILIPTATFEARLGLGRSTSLEVRYRNLAVVGHLAQTRFTWATPMFSAFLDFTVIVAFTKPLTLTPHIAGAVAGA